MANKKPSVSKKESANKTKNNLCNLPLSVRRSSELTPSAKKLLNHLLSLRYEWDNPTSFFRSNKDIMDETGMEKRSFKRARGVLVDNKILTFESKGIRGEATVYYFNPEFIETWQNEKKNVLLQASTKSAKGGNTFETSESEVIEFRGAVKGGTIQDNNLNDNNFKGGTLGGHSNLDLGGQNDNENNDNDMTKNEMLVKILERLDIMESKLNNIAERIDKKDRELTESLKQTTEAIKAMSLGGHYDASETPCAPPITISNTISKTKKEEGKEKDKKEKSDAVPSLSSSSNFEIEVRSGDNAIINSIVSQIDQAFAKWENDHNPQHEQFIKAQCATLTYMRKDNLVNDVLWKGIKDKLNVMKSKMTATIPQAPQPQQTPQAPLPSLPPQSPYMGMGMSKKDLNDKVSELFNLAKQTRELWKEDHDNAKADRAMGQVLQDINQLQPLGISESQYTTCWNIVRDYYQKNRKMTDIPDINALLTSKENKPAPAMTAPFTTPVLTRQQVETIEYAEEYDQDGYLLRLRNTPYTHPQPMGSEDAQKILDDIRTKIITAIDTLNDSPTEARRLIENAKHSLRIIVDNYGQWEKYADGINYNLASSVVVVEYLLTRDVEPLKTFVYRSIDYDVKALALSLYGVFDMLRKMGVMDNQLGEVEEYYKECWQMTPVAQPAQTVSARVEEPKALTLPHPKPTEDEEDDEMPF